MPKYIKCQRCTNEMPTICAGCAVGMLKMKELEKLHLEDFDFVIVKDQSTFQIFQSIMENYPKKVIFVYAPEGLEKLSRSEVEGALKKMPSSLIIPLDIV